MSQEFAGGIDAFVARNAPAVRPPEPAAEAVQEPVETPIAEEQQTAEPTTAAPVKPTEPAKVNLDDFEEFRKYKSSADQRIAQAARQAEQERVQREAIERQMAELRGQVEEMQLQNAEPEEVAAYYRKQLSQVQEEQRRQQEQARQTQQISDRALGFLEKLGLPADAPGLDWSGGATPDGLIALMESATSLMAERGKEMTHKQQADVEKATREAEQRALQQAGVTKVSTATGAAPSGLQRQYESEIAALRGSGNLNAALEVKERYRRQGLKV